MAISNQHCLYGELICNFANAKTSDDAGVKFLEDIKKALLADQGYPSVHDEFPTRNKILSTLKEKEIKLMELMRCYDQILNKIEVSYLNYGFNLTGYDRKSNGLILQKVSTPINYDENGNLIKNIIFRNTYNVTIKDIDENYDFFFRFEGTAPQKKLLEAMNGLKEMDDIIESSKKSFSEDEYKNIYKPLLIEHDFIIFLRNKLKVCLDHIIEKKPLDNDCQCDEIESFLSTYNKLNTPNAHYDHHYGIVKTNPLFRADFFLNRLETKPVTCLPEYYTEPIAYCLVEFLKDADHKNYLKKCHYCEKYHLRKNIVKHGQYFCSDKCRLDFHNKKNIKSGKHAAYKRNKRKEGARESYY